MALAVNTTNLCPSASVVVTIAQIFDGGKAKYCWF